MAEGVGQVPQIPEKQKESLFVIAPYPLERQSRMVQEARAMQDTAQEIQPSRKKKVSFEEPF